IGARAERAPRAGEHRHRRRVFGVEASKSVSEIARRLGIDRVGDLGAIDRDDRHLVVALIADAHLRFTEELSSACTYSRSPTARTVASAGPRHVSAAFTTCGRTASRK